LPEERGISRADVEENLLPPLSWRRRVVAQIFELFPIQGAAP
jgi:hypothetical protein